MEEEETGEGHRKISNMAVLKDFDDIKMVVLWILSHVSSKCHQYRLLYYMNSEY